MGSGRQKCKQAHNGLIKYATNHILYEGVLAVLIKGDSKTL